MTSNIASQLIRESTEKKVPYEKIKTEVMGELSHHFRPEFLNRLDEIIVFHPLGKKEIVQIVDLLLKGLSKQLLEKGYTLSVTDRAKELLAEVGFDPVFGARPLKRAIQQQVVNALAKEMLAGKYVPGQNIEVDAKNGAVTFTTREPVAVKA